MPHTHVWQPVRQLFLVSAVAHRSVSAATPVASVLDSLTHCKTTWLRGKQRRCVMVFATCQFVDALHLRFCISFAMVRASHCILTTLWNSKASKHWHLVLISPISHSKPWLRSISSCSLFQLAHFICFEVETTSGRTQAWKVAPGGSTKALNGMTYQIVFKPWISGWWVQFFFWGTHPNPSVISHDITHSWTHASHTLYNIVYPPRLPIHSSPCLFRRFRSAGLDHWDGVDGYFLESSKKKQTTPLGGSEWARKFQCIPPVGVVADFIIQTYDIYIYLFTSASHQCRPQPSTTWLASQQQVLTALTLKWYETFRTIWHKIYQANTTTPNTRPKNT